MRHCMLAGSIHSEGNKLMHGADRSCQFLTGDREADFPSGHSECFSRRRNRDCAFTHLRKGGRGNVCAIIECQKFVYLVADHQKIMAPGSVRNDIEFLM